MLLAQGTSIATIAGVVEEDKYANSETNSGRYAGYLTDHTDLGSDIDIDESEYRRQLLNDKWRLLFDRFDPEGFGEIPRNDFLQALTSAEWINEIPSNKRDILLTRVKESHLNAVTFQDFVNVKPETLGINGARNFYLHTNENIKIGVWQILPQLCLNETKIIDDNYFDNVLSNTNIPIILYLHGIFSNRALDHRVKLYKLLQKMNYHVITFDYRCFGDSDYTDLSEIGVVEDSKYVLQWIMSKVKNNSTPIFVWGHSLGSGISLHTLAQLAAKNIYISGLFLESPFTNIADVYRGTIFYKLFSFLPWFYWSIIEPVDKQNLKFQSDKHIGNVNCPIIIIHAEDDKIVPFKLGEKLYNIGLESYGKSVNNFQMIRIKSTFNCGHKCIYKYEKLPEIIENFIAKYSNTK